MVKKEVHCYMSEANAKVISVSWSDPSLLYHSLQSLKLKKKDLIIKKWLKNKIKEDASQNFRDVSKSIFSFSIRRLFCL